MHDTILVPGGAGFVGSSLCIALRREFPETRILALDNLRRRGSELNLPRLSAAGVTFIHGDIRSPGDLACLEDFRPGLIIECSAEPSAQAGYGSSPEYLIQTNLAGCFHCLELARRLRSHFLFVSTSRVYPFARINQLPYIEQPTRFCLDLRTPSEAAAGVSARGITEEFPLEGARSLYGMTKLAAELMVEEYADAYDLPFIIDRAGLLTGPWQMAKSDQGVIALWMGAHYFRHPLAYIGFGGTGKQVRDLLHIEDFCALVIDQIRNWPHYNRRRFNIGGGPANSLSLLETTVLCEQITGNRISMGSIVETRPADLRVYTSDCSRVSAVNGWHPKRTPQTTLTTIFEWLHAEESRLRPLFAT